MTCKRKEKGCLHCVTHKTGHRTMETTYKEQILHQCNEALLRNQGQPAK